MSPGATAPGSTVATPPVPKPHAAFVQVTPVMGPDAWPQYTVESAAWQLTPNVRSTELPGPSPNRRGFGAVPSSTGIAPSQRICSQDGEPEPTVRLKLPVQLPCAAPTSSVKGMDVPHATVGGIQTPKWGAIEPTVAPLATFSSAAPGRV